MAVPRLFTRTRAFTRTRTFTRTAGEAGLLPDFSGHALALALSSAPRAVSLPSQQVMDFSGQFTPAVGL